MACGATAKLVTGSVIAAILIAVGVGMIWEFKIVIRNKIESVSICQPLLPLFCFD